MPLCQVLPQDTSDDANALDEPAEPDHECPRELAEDASEYFEAVRAFCANRGNAAEAEQLLRAYDLNDDTAMPACHLFINCDNYSRYLLTVGVEPTVQVLRVLAQHLLGWFEGYPADNVIAALRNPDDFIVKPALRGLAARLWRTGACHRHLVQVGIFGRYFLVDAHRPVVSTPVVHQVRIVLPLSLIVHFVLHIGRGRATDFEANKLIKMYLDVVTPAQLEEDAETLNRRSYALGTLFRQSLPERPPRLLVNFRVTDHAFTNADAAALLSVHPALPEYNLSWFSRVPCIVEVVDEALADSGLPRYCWPRFGNHFPPEWALRRARDASLVRLQTYLSWLLHTVLHYRNPDHWPTIEAAVSSLPPYAPGLPERRPPEPRRVRTRWH